MAKVKFTFGVPDVSTVPSPALVNNGIVLDAWPLKTLWSAKSGKVSSASVVVGKTVNNSLPSVVLEPIGNVAPDAETIICPVPSDEIVEPPKSIVFDSRNIFLNLFVAEPKLNVPVWAGIISEVRLWRTL